MSAVSLTTFIDFVCKAGTPKLTVVKNWKHKPKYSPASDYYKSFREAVIDMHENGQSITSLSNLAKKLTNATKRTHYNDLIAGYKKWQGRKNAVWFAPPKTTWTFQRLNVSVNPEIGLEINGVPHLIKLYMKADDLAKNRIDLVTNLLALSCSQKAPQGCVMGILDARRSRLFTPPSPNALLTTQLQGEAAYWNQVWKSV